MNERIRELAEQIVCFEQDMDGSMEPNEDGQWIRVDELEKFAELIVGECSGIVQNYMSRWPEDCDLVIKIKEHFGVEE
jgi:hypothetical protein